ncbi:hypothetical protein BGS_0794 [Beggiatoa sp. SS]|nr:hypothetical protein BGS_0794 [Beggiatoa sp. SS]
MPRGSDFCLGGVGRQGPKPMEKTAILALRSHELQKLSHKRVSEGLKLWGYEVNRLGPLRKRMIVMVVRSRIRGLSDH